MYSLCLRRDFTARHALLGGDWGAENVEHAHDYRVEWELRAPTLDVHGYLVDLVEVERSLDGVLARYSGAFLNNLPEFADSNPSLERFARVLWEKLSSGLREPIRCTVRVWENDTAWAGFEGSP